MIEFLWYDGSPVFSLGDLYYGPDTRWISIGARTRDFLANIASKFLIILSGLYSLLFQLVWRRHDELEVEEGVAVLSILACVILSGR